MKKEDIHLEDLYRILHGEVPLEFYFELIIRSVFVYLVLTFGMKLMGKRLSAEMSLSELAAIATLAAATGLVILAPERGLIPPLIVIAVVLCIKWLTHIFGKKHPTLEKVAEGTLSVLIDNGVLRLHEMKKTRISQEQLFAQLRQSQIMHLGTVKRLYLEANGSFSIVKNKEPFPGLAVLPEWDQEFIDEQPQSESQVCGYCGNIREKSQHTCPVCDNNEWKTALI
ncbi:MAG: DUF421 domain-containing protein [Agriterribacter sp.]